MHAFEQSLTATVLFNRYIRWINAHPDIVTIGDELTISSQAGADWANHAWKCLEKVVNDAKPG